MTKEQLKKKVPGVRFSGKLRHIYVNQNNLTKEQKKSIQNFADETGYEVRTLAGN
jgi:hypothetical protein